MDNPGRKIISFKDSSWGELILPAPDESPGNVNIVGLVTGDPANLRARISAEIRTYPRMSCLACRPEAVP